MVGVGVGVGVSVGAGVPFGKIRSELFDWVADCWNDMSGTEIIVGLMLESENNILE